MVPSVHNSTHSIGSTTIGSPVVSFAWVAAITGAAAATATVAGTGQFATSAVGVTELGADAKAVPGGGSVGGRRLHGRRGRRRRRWCERRCDRRRGGLSRRRRRRERLRRLVGHEWLRGRAITRSGNRQSDRGRRNWRREGIAAATGTEFASAA